MTDLLQTFFIIKAKIMCLLNELKNKQNHLWQSPPCTWIHKHTTTLSQFSKDKQVKKERQKKSVKNKTISQQESKSGITVSSLSTTTHKNPKIHTFFY
jgi:hypothetical protein